MAKCMRLFLLAKFALCLSAFAAGAATLDTITERTSVRIGYIADEAPFSSSNRAPSRWDTPSTSCGKIADEIERQVPAAEARIHRVDARQRLRCGEEWTGRLCFAVQLPST